MFISINIYWNLRIIICGLFELEHFVLYRNIESCVPGTNIALKVNYISRTDKQTHKKKIGQAYDYQKQDQGRGN